uniref:SacI homology domain containing protein, putative n=1 Tax=Theileria annulata TaxID=5874 RepID=A0A3B0N1U4_THEAN
MNNYSVIKYCSLYESDSRVTFCEPSGRTVVFEKNNLKVSVHDYSTDDTESKFLFNCYGILGSITFMNLKYLIVVTRATLCGRLFLEHDVYSINSKKLIPVFYPVNLSSREREFLRLFNDFDTSSNFYFSYTYNLANTLQLNLSYKSLLSEKTNLISGENDWMAFDPALVDQKYCYNFNHKIDLCSIDERCFGLSLLVIHGYFSESMLSLSGRNVTYTLISRRSRFYSGTRYRKRGITGSGQVANDVETEQTLHDWSMTRSVSSFVLVRGSIPTFWSQDPSESFLKKPPIIYSQNDPTNSSVRSHFMELLSCYGGPLVVLDLLSDNPTTEEGQLSDRYRRIIEDLNTELPSFLKIIYYSKNIKSLLEKGVAKQMVKDVVETVVNTLKLTYLPSFNSNSENYTNLINPQLYSNDMIIQKGVIRISCLDCLDRTSAFSKHLSLRMLKYQLELIGIRVNYELSTYFTNYSPIQNLSFNENYVQNVQQSRGSLSNSSASFSSNSMSSRSSSSLDLKVIRDGISSIGDVVVVDKDEGIIVSDYFGFNNVKGLMFEIVKDRYEEMCDVLSMQYAGSKALRKYEGHISAINISRELFTNVRRRYRNYFEDTRIQEQTNAFLWSEFISYYSQVCPNIEQYDLDDIIHFKPINMQFNTIDSFVLALVVFNKRISKLSNHNTLCANNVLDEDLNYLIYTRFFDLVSENTSSITKELDSTEDNSDHICDYSLDGTLMSERTDVLNKIMFNYLTLDYQLQDGYTFLCKYKPAGKIIPLDNCPSLDYSSDILITPFVSPIIPDHPVEEVEQVQDLNLQDNSSDFINFLAPLAHYDPSHWTLNIKSNINSLNNFINVTI